MSTKCSMLYLDIKVFKIHIYKCFVKGYNIDLNIMGKTLSIPLSESEGKDLENQLEDL